MLDPSCFIRMSLQWMPLQSSSAHRSSIVLRWLGLHAPRTMHSRSSDRRCGALMQMSCKSRWLIPSSRFTSSDRSLHSTKTSAFVLTVHANPVHGSQVSWILLKAAVQCYGVRQFMQALDPKNEHVNISKDKMHATSGFNLAGHQELW